MQQVSEYDCPICMSLIIEPVQLNECNHTFCLDCIDALLDQSADKLKCPMCRKITKQEGPLIINLELQQKIKETNPGQFILLTEQLQKKRQENITFVKLKIYYGNSHKIVNNQSSNSHEWTLFVNVKFARDDQKNLMHNPNDIIQTVTYKLHPTFHPAKIELTKAPYKLTRLGWGVFNIPIILTFKPKYQLQDLKVHHYLSFENDGDQSSTIVQINKSILGID